MDKEIIEKMSENKILTREEYAMAHLGTHGFKTYNEYIAHEKRKQILNAIEVLKEVNGYPFYPNQEINLTQVMNGFSAGQLNKINDVVDLFSERITDWDYREGSE